MVVGAFTRVVRTINGRRTTFRVGDRVWALDVARAGRATITDLRLVQGRTGRPAALALIRYGGKGKRKLRESVVQSVARLRKGRVPPQKRGR